MTNLEKARKLFKRSDFSLETCAKGLELLKGASAAEQVMIKKLFESQYTLCKTPEDLESLQKLMQGLG